MDTIKLWGSRVGAAGWLDAHPEAAGEPVCVRTILNHNGWQIGEEWAVLTAAGYVPGEERKGQGQRQAGG